MNVDVENLYNRRADQRWERMAAGDILERMTWSEPDKLAFVAAPCAIQDPQFARVSYGAADRICNRIAHALIAQGLERGARVALLCDNSVDAFLVKLGVAKAGMVVVPINTMMAPDMVEHMLRLVDARVALMDASLWDSGRVPFDRAGVRLLASIGTPGHGIPGVPDLSAFIADQPEQEPDVTIHGDDIWEILPTSGTTSMPKAVMISHAYTYLGGMSNALSFSRGVPCERDFKMCSFLPVIFHVGDQALAMSPLLCGGTVVIGRRFDAAAIAASITREQPTALWGGSPQLIGELVREVESKPGTYDLSSLTVLVYGWGQLAPELSARVLKLAPRALLSGIFGQTECISFHRFWPSRWPEQYARHAPAVNYVGLPSPLLASTVMDEEGRALHTQARKPGEAVYRSPAITSGYFRDEPATREAFRHGWFHSGDMCETDEDGLRIMLDRYKDMIKSGGENVSSLRVEAVIAQHPSVRKAAVIGVPDAKWGEKVVGMIVLMPDAVLDEAGIIAFCRERLAGYETPKQIVVIDDLPVTVGGKVLKYKLRQMLATTCQKQVT